MKINQAGLDLIKSFEKCKLSAYKDAVGIWTIGWGHVGTEAKPGVVITQQRADELLVLDIGKFESQVSEIVKAPINENQFSALVCLAFNCGINNIRTSHLIRYVNESNYLKAADEFPKWDHAGGKELPGLLRRREAERALFLS